MIDMMAPIIDWTKGDALVNDAAQASGTERSM